MNSSRTSAPAPHAEFFPPPPRPALWPVRWLARIVQDRRELVRFWPVVANMVGQELQVRYQRSVLGFVWTLLNPILMMTVMAIVFSQVLDLELKSYAIYLFAGMLPWSFLSGSLIDCSVCIIINEGLIRKIYLPKLIFPLVRVLINLTTFVLSLSALFLLAKPLGAKFSWALLMVPLAVALLAMFALGLGLIVATMNTFYRDCGHLVTVFLQAWYFATPIIYDPVRLKWPPHLLARFWFNPAYPFVRLFQVILNDGHWPDLTLLLVAAGYATVSLGVGYAAFKLHEDKLVFRL